MRRLVLFLLTLCLALPVAAERKQRFGDLEVHYNVFNSTFLQPDVAAGYGLQRGPRLGVLNLSVLKAGQGQQARVNGELRNLLGQRQPLEFREIVEDNAVYYLAQFPIDSREVLHFSLTIRLGEGPEHKLDFSQEVFPE